MAGGKLSPRQRMINLMYLIFIAMLAMNMSKEVLSAFGIMNQRLEEANTSATQRNAAYMAGLAEKAVEQPEKYAPLKTKAERIAALSNEFDSYLEEVKTGLKSSVKEADLNSGNYEAMDKTDYFDIRFFKGDNYTEAGQEFLDKINNYREQVKNILADDDEVDFSKIINDMDTKFHTNDEPRRDGVKVPWLSYHYQGFPMVASLAKLTQMQSDVKVTTNEILSAMLEGQMASDLSMSKYEAIVIPEKTAFFNGENFKGRIVLGRFDETMNFHKIIVNGKEVTQTQAGQVVLDFPAGNVGEQEIKGELQFMEDGDIVPIEFTTSYAVIPKPNAAVISADKMNVVYRGVDNPMTISIPGVGNVEARAPGLVSAGGAGKYMMNVTSVQGREVTITVSGKLPDGEPITDSKVYRIKDIPRPVGTVRGEDGIIKMQKSNLQISTIGAALPDFDFDLKLEVTGFKFNVPGQPTINVTGNKLNPQAIDALNKARRGETVQIFDINARIAGNSSYMLPRVSAVFVELTN